MLKIFSPNRILRVDDESEVRADESRTFQVSIDQPIYEPDGSVLASQIVIEADQIRDTVV